MLKKFYIVQDKETTGGMIPFQIMPFALPKIVPMPIAKTAGIEIPAVPFGLPMQMPMTMGLPIGQSMFDYSGKKPEPTLLSTSYSVMSPYGPSYTTPSYSAISPYSRPIIKMGPMMSQNISGRIEIIIGQDVHTLLVPYMHFRTIVNDIYYNPFAPTDDPTQMVMIRIISPGINTTVNTTFGKMMGILARMGNYGVQYRTNDGHKMALSVLFDMLKSMSE